MAYNAIGNRVVLTGWVSGVAYTTTYASRIAGKVQILQATSGVNSTSYLYGLNQIGEFGLQSVYYLTDGAGSVRHLVDPNGAVKLVRLYEPFGQVLMQKGSGDPIYGYLGAQFDRISGLMYINGAYYDPVTGRFLSPSSGGPNPYVPLGGAALAPILILALIGRRKKGKIWTGWVVIALIASVGLTLAACIEQTPPSTPKPPTPRPIPGITATATSMPAPISSLIPATPTAVPLPPTPVACPMPTSTATAIPENLRNLARITPDEIAHAGGLREYLLSESDALTLTRVAMGESNVYMQDRNYIMWLIKMRAELGYQNSSSRGINPPNNRWGASTSIKTETLSETAINSQQFEPVTVVITQYENNRAGFDPSGYPAGSNLRAMLSPTDEQLPAFIETYQTASTLVSTSFSSMPEELKGFDSFRSSSSPQGEASWIGGRTSSQLVAGGNVYRDDSWIDNIYFGLVTCEYVAANNRDRVDFQCPGTPTPSQP